MGLFCYFTAAILVSVQGSFWVLLLYDVAEAIDIAILRSEIGEAEPSRQPSFRHPTPEYVRFQGPPVIERIENLTFAGQHFDARLKYFQFGVISLELRMTFDADWPELIQLSNRWVAAPEIEQRAGEIVRQRIMRVRPALVRPYTDLLSEDYCIIRVEPTMDAATLLANCGPAIAQIVRGESVPLSSAENREILQPSISYYPNDLLVVGWMAAFIYDDEEDAAPVIQLLEYANTQLLEFRYYDELLTRVLAEVYKMLEHRGGVFRGWRMSREAERLNTIRLDITELTERMDNSIKFLSDMFYARMFRTIAERVGGADYRQLVDRKLRTAGDLYEFMTNEFHQSRAFVLEFLVVMILVIELVMLFRGK